MPKRIITELSNEQEAMLPIYRDKWRAIGMSTKSIEQERVAAVIKAAYVASDYPESEILFYGSHFTAISQVIAIENFKVYIGLHISIKFIITVVDSLRHQIREQLEEHLFIRLRNQVQLPEFPYYPSKSNPQVSYFPYIAAGCIEHQLSAELDKGEFEFTDNSYFTRNLNKPAKWAICVCMCDFGISVFNLNH